MRRSPHRRAGLLLAVGALALAGCVSDTRPDDATCRAPSIELAVTLEADALTGDTLSVCRGQAVTIGIDPQIDGVFHIHGYDAQVPATMVSEGTPIELEFVADVSGQFPIEFHGIEDPRGIGIGVFTVHEP